MDITGERARRARRIAGRAGAGALLWAVLHLFGCGATTDPVRPAPPGPAPPLRVAVFPVENLSGRRAPIEEVRALVVAGLERGGLSVMDEARLEAIFTRHRVRFAAGIDAGLARAFKEEAGVDAIAIPSLELYEDSSPPPRVSLFLRLVATGDTPRIRWIDSAGVAGDDAPGILGIGMIHDPRALLAKVVDDLTRSLARDLAAAASGPPDRPAAARFRPKIVYRSEALDPARAHSVAIVPFFNKSARRYAGEIIALHMMTALTAFPSLQVVESGVVRQELLRYRIIMSDGVSLPETDTILGAVNADLVLNGEVLEYEDRRGPTPRVDFSVLFIERQTRRIVYSSYSQAAGDDGVFFFDWKRVNTAHGLAAQMARAAGERLVKPLSGPRPR